MQIRFFIIFLPLILAGCSYTEVNQVPSDKEFSVPTDIAEKFEVREETLPLIIMPAPEVSETAKVKPKKLSKKEIKAKKLEIAKKKKMEWKNRLTMTPFFHTGERYLFDITYFGATAGQLEIETLPPKVIADRQAY